jgi:uroporphyrinogen decarboxylase
MDLSLEAETYGCEIRMSDRDVPTVVGRRAAGPAEIAALPDPKPGDARTKVPLEAVRQLAAAAPGVPMLGCMIGPFSLAGRIFGVSEALEATALEPETVEALLEKVTSFLIRYAVAFREAGAWGVVMAEPAAGLLSPGSVGRFSVPFIRRIVEAVETPDFSIILHNCGAKLVHLEKTLESGAAIYHFSSPMDIVAALHKVRAGGGGSAAARRRVILGGNLDPSAIFYSGSPGTVRRETQMLLEATKRHRNFIISSGCDIPPGTPLRNIEAFYDAVADFNRP